MTAPAPGIHPGDTVTVNTTETFTVERVTNGFVYGTDGQAYALVTGSGIVRRWEHVAPTDGR